jgi:4-hydroxy-tetrahydrodipicolinate synthase
MKNGFYPALGTPTGANGRLAASSYKKEIDLMIEAGAQGLLCMGSMGRMETIPDREYPVIAKACVEMASRKIPIMVGVMDCCVSRVLERINALGKIDIDGVVATVPFYARLNERNAVNFFTLLAKSSPYPVYVYDLPSVTQLPVTENILNGLLKQSNIKGIKTANLQLISGLLRNPVRQDDFSVFYSGLDLFDIAIRSGIGKNLDGMFTCTPYNSEKMYESAAAQDHSQVSECLNNILRLRNLLLKEDLFQAYSHAMGLLGCPGDYHPDYSSPVSAAAKDEIRNCMKEIGEIHP